MKKLLSVAVFSITLAGCASSTSEYYEAVQKAAEANALASQAKYAALSKIAESGDGQAASAAVMALALTQTPTITPIPQQSQAIQWASILAAPLSNLGMMWMQTDSTKAMAEYNKDVSLARISADSVNQQALYGAFTDQAGLTANVATTGLTAMGNVDYTPWINGLVELGQGGLNAVTDVSTAGINGVTSVSNVGFGAVVDITQDNHDFVTGIVTQYNATVNNLIENPLTNTVTNTTTNTTTTNTQSTVACSVDATGVVTCN